MSSIDHNPFKAELKAPKEPYEKLVENFLGSEAREMYEKKHVRQTSKKEIEEGEPSFSAPELTQAEQETRWVATLEREAKGWFDRAKSIASDLPSTEDCEAYAFIATQQARAGLNPDVAFKQAKEALQKANELATPYGLIEIAKAVHAVGRDSSAAFLEADESIAWVDDGDTQNVISEKLANELIIIGKFNEASAVAATLSDEFSRSKIYLNIALEMHKLGQDPQPALNAAFKAGALIKDLGERASKFTFIATQLGDFKEWQRSAFNVAFEADLENKKTLDNFSSAWNFCVLAESILYAGEDPAAALREAADSAAWHLQEFKPAEQIQKFLGTVYAQAGRISDARETMKNILNLESRDEVLSDIVYYYASTGEVDRAFEVILETKDKVTSFQKLASVATDLVKRGDLDKALKIVNRIEDLNVRESTLDSLVTILSEQGRFDEAAHLAQTIPFSDSRTQAYTALVQRLSQAGKFDEAIKLLAEVTDVNFKEPTLLILTNDLIKAGRLDDAITFANQLDEAPGRFEVFSSLAAKLCEASQDPRPALASANQAALDLGVNLATSKAYALNAVAPILTATKLKKLWANK